MKVNIIMAYCFLFELRKGRYGLDIWLILALQQVLWTGILFCFLLFSFSFLFSERGNQLMNCFIWKPDTRSISKCLILARLLVICIILSKPKVQQTIHGCFTFFAVVFYFKFYLFLKYFLTLITPTVFSRCQWIISYTVIF